MGTWAVQKKDHRMMASGLGFQLCRGKCSQIKIKKQKKLYLSHAGHHARHASKARRAGAKSSVLNRLETVRF
jgi:hypothetical protein